MPVPENFNSESETPFSQHHRFNISRVNLVIIICIFFCSIVAACFLVYNFAACPQILPIENAICEHHDDVVPLVVQDIENGAETFSRGDGSESTNTSRIENLRLPLSVIPIAYDLRLIPFMSEKNFTFHGDVTILANVTEDTNNITLHAVALKIRDTDIVVRVVQNSTVNVDQNTSSVLNVTKQYFVETSQFFVMEFDTPLKNMTVLEIQISFKGVLNDYLQGFYKSSYAIGNETRWVVATQFQPTDARRAFPCFDEPALKAKFNLTLARPKNMSTLSNMPKLEQSIPVNGLDDYVWDIYQPSVPMSTYLLAFVVTDFTNRTSDRFSVWTRTDAIRSASYALEIGPKLLKFLETFFDIPYPLPKMDMIALPDFTAGAMENWGLITFREAAMLYEDGITARMNKQRVATIIAHELAHQWFGNLVTPSWWSDLWLNEGFASYMEYVGVDAVETTWKSMDQFVVHELQGVFTLDALSSSHKIWIEVHNPEEINEIFDRISYGKGATIIRMMDHFLTAKVFKRGLTNYLRTMAYQAADQEDLWRFLTDEARSAAVLDNTTSVKEIMDTWTLQTGFPVVTVTRNYEDKTLAFAQERFFYNVDEYASDATDDNKPIWTIPITYTSERELEFAETKPSHWLRSEKMEINHFNLSYSHWLIVNIQQTGYYRVNYDHNNWKLISTYLQNATNYAKIAPSNRAQIIDDALNLARGGYLSYQIAMDVTKYLIHEHDYVPWKSAINAMNFIDSMMIKRGDYYKFKNYFLNLLGNIYSEIGFEDTKDSDMLTVYKRIDILLAACHLGYPDCVDNSYRAFQNWMMEPNPDNINPISPNIRTVVYCTAIKRGDQLEWDFAWERFQKTTVSSEKEILLSALGCSRETWILNRYLDMSITESSGIRKHDVFRVFAAVSGNVMGEPIAFNFIRNNWQKMKDYLGASMANLNAIVKYCTRRLNNKFELEEFKRFAMLHLKEGGRSIQQAIEYTEANIEWMDKNYNTIVKWLGNVTYSTNNR